MDIFQWLIQDHQITEQRFAEIEKTAEKEAEHRELLFAKLREGLEAHEVLEEECLFPEIDEVLLAKDVVAEALDEHAEFDAILQEISEIRANKGEWLEKVCELKDLVRGQVRKEEEKMFPLARIKLGQSRAEELGRQIQERQKSL
jgi:iron-sulfur cluster repair protein YtfE (RIC family)